MNAISRIRAQVAQLKSECPDNAAYPIIEALVDEVCSLKECSFKQFLTLKEACEYTGYSRNKMYALVRDSKVPYSKPEDGGSGKLFFNRKDLDEYMGRNRFASTYETDMAAASHLAR